MSSFADDEEPAGEGEGGGGGGGGGSEEGIGGGNEAKETLEMMERRHKAERRELEGQVRAMLKGAKKSAKAELEAKAIQMEFDMKARHLEELEELEEEEEGEGEGKKEATSSGGKGKIVEEEMAAAAAAEAAAEAAAAAARKAKAQRKKDKAKSKEQEKLALKEEMSANAGPSPRDVELQAINRILAPDRLVVKEVLSDGNCLYRAVADQLAVVPSSSLSSSHTFVTLRKEAADYMRAHQEDFAPFLGLEGLEYLSYCDKVADVAGAEWGGQLEVRALCACLRYVIMHTHTRTHTHAHTHTHTHTQTNKPNLTALLVFSQAENSYI